MTTEADSLTDEHTKDELYEMASDRDITGRGDMDKEDLAEAIVIHDTTVADEDIPESFKDALDTEAGMYASMSHLESYLEITDVQRGKDLAIVMETNYGGRHRLLLRKTGPRLERWRAGDEEWMKNSHTPEFFKLVNKFAVGVSLYASITYDEELDVDEAQEQALDDVEHPDKSFDVHTEESYIDVADDETQVSLDAVTSITVEATSFEEALSKAQSQLNDMKLGDFTSPSYENILNETTGESVHASDI